MNRVPVIRDVFFVTLPDRLSGGGYYARHRQALFALLRLTLLFRTNINLFNINLL